MKGSGKEWIKLCGRNNKYVKAHTGVGGTQIYHPTNLQATPEEATGIIDDYRRNTTNAAPIKAIFSRFATSAELLSPATGVGAVLGGNLEGKVLGNGGLLVEELGTPLKGEEAGVIEATGATDGGDGGEEIGDTVGVATVGPDVIGLTLGLPAFIGVDTGEETGDAFFGEDTGDLVVEVGAPAVFDGEAAGDCAQHEEPIKLTIKNIVTATALVPAIVSDSNDEEPQSV